jgi:hypothetical protein
MAKDLFDDAYFERHRNRSEWDSFGKRGISGLNVKNKPKPREIAALPQISHDDIEDIPVTRNMHSDDSWRAEYRKALTAGFAGGFIVLLVLRMNMLDKSLFTIDFWISSIITVVIVLIFVYLFEMPFRIANK